MPHTHDQAPDQDPDAMKPLLPPSPEQARIIYDRRGRMKGVRYDLPFDNPEALVSAEFWPDALNPAFPLEIRAAIVPTPAGKTLVLGANLILRQLLTRAELHRAHVQLLSRSHNVPSADGLTITPRRWTRILATNADPDAALDAGKLVHILEASHIDAHTILTAAAIHSDIERADDESASHMQILYDAELE